ncbi:thiamine pyrophosphate-dependent enzyme, partial [Streptomyces sp. NPDC001215]
DVDGRPVTEVVSLLRGDSDGTDGAAAGSRVRVAVGAQHRIPYIHVLVNNAYLGLIRQAQRAFDIDFHVKQEFENINSPELGVYGVDHVKVAEGLGCKAIRVTDPAGLGAAFEQAGKLAAEHRVPVVVEVILERVTDISMSTTNDIGAVVEFEETATEPGHAPTSIRTLKI